jgi:hypothetical protein
MAVLESGTVRVAATDGVTPLRRAVDVLIVIPAYSFVLGTCYVFRGLVTGEPLHVGGVLTVGIYATIIGSAYGWLAYLLMTVWPWRIPPHPLLEIFMVLAVPLTSLLMLDLGAGGGIIGAVCASLMAPFLARAYGRFRAIA